MTDQEILQNLRQNSPWQYWIAESYKVLLQTYLRRSSVLGPNHAVHLPVTWIIFQKTRLKKKYLKENTVQWTWGKNISQLFYMKQK